MTDFDAFIAASEVFFAERPAMKREDFRKLVRQYEGCRFYVCSRHTVKQDAIDFAIEKLESGHDRADIAKRLMGLFDISSVTAYKRINQAMDIMSKRAIYSESA